MSNESDLGKEPKKESGNLPLQLVWWGGIGLIIVLVYGAFTGKLWGDSGVECYPYEQPNGELVSTCDDGYPGTR
jgi:hypothetical protein